MMSADLELGGKADEGLAGAASHVIDRFSGVVSNLEQVRSAIADLDTALDQLQGNAPDAAGGPPPVAGVVTAIEGIDAALECAVAGLSAPEFEHGTKRIRDLIHRVERISDEMSVIATLTAVTVAAEKQTDFDVAGYIKGLRELASNLDDATGGIGRALNAVDSDRAETALELRAARETIRRSLADVRATACDTGTSEGTHEADAQARDIVRALAQHCARAMSPVVACLQFPDALSQRAEHVQTALARVEGGTLDADTGAATRLVAEAQCRDMCESLIETLHDADGGLHLIAKEADTARAGLGSTVMSRHRAAALESGRDALDGAIEAMSLIQTRAQSAYSRISTVLEALEGARKRFADLTSVGEVLRVSAFNVGIAARRMKTQSKAMDVLANAARGAASECRESIAGLEEAFSDLVGLQNALDTDSLTAAIETGEEQSRAARDDLDRMARRLGDLRDGSKAAEDAISRLASAVSGARSRIAETRSDADLLRKVAETIAHRRGGARPGGDLAALDLSFLSDAYTMDQERRVHAQALGLDFAASASHAAASQTSFSVGAVADEDDLDDILF